LEIRVYHRLPDEASEIRKDVFIGEQGFESEFDQTDAKATHLLLFRDGIPAGTCRFFPGETAGDYLIGRLAVRKEYRGLGLGAELMRAAEEEIRKERGHTVALHAQQQARPFYEKQGYSAYGEGDLDEGCPHIWMRKKI
jgi:predicted GNAT family N-acyltransferase